MTSLQDAKALARRYWAACDAANGAGLASCLADHMQWDGPAPVLPARSAEEVQAHWAAPLRAALPGLKRQFHILMAGKSSGRVDGSEDGRLWVAGSGYLLGQATDAFLDIPATDAALRLRWGEFLCIEGDRIVEVQMLVDFVDWFEQIGRLVLPRPHGVPGVYPAATGYDAVLEAEADAEETATSLRLGRDLVFGGLNVFDQDDLSSMGMARFFHDNIKWYGPGGIGACLSLREFEERHQKIWLEAFPDRKVQDLTSLFAEDRMVAASGTAGVRATHTGPYLGQSASGAELEISGLDFWLRSDGKFTENWVFVDMVDLFGQLGVDLFARMKEGGLT